MTFTYVPNVHQFRIDTEDRLTLQNRLDSAAAIGDYDEKKNLVAIEDVGDSTRAHLVKGSLGYCS